MFQIRVPRLIRLTGVGRGVMATAGAVALIGAVVGVAAGVSASPQIAVQPTAYVSLTPNRVLDTRSGNGLTHAFVSGIPRTFTVTGEGYDPRGDFKLNWT